MKKTILIASDIVRRVHSSPDSATNLATVVEGILKECCAEEAYEVERLRSYIKALNENIQERGGLHNQIVTSLREIIDTQKSEVASLRETVKALDARLEQRIEHLQEAESRVVLRSLDEAAQRVRAQNAEQALAQVTKDLSLIREEVLRIKTSFDMAFESWFTELKKIAVAQFQFNSDVALAPDGWMHYFNEGYTPVGALKEDASNG